MTCLVVTCFCSVCYKAASNLGPLGHRALQRPLSAQLLSAQLLSAQLLTDRRLTDRRLHTRRLHARQLNARRTRRLGA